MVREYMCMTFSKNAEDFLFAGTSSGDFCGFQVKNKILVFAINCVAQGVKIVQAVTADKVCVGGGDGQVILFQINGKDTAQLLKVTLYGGQISGLSASPDGL